MTTNVPSARTARVALAFSCLGHAYSQLFAPIFYVVVLALEHEFMLTHGAAAALIGFGVQVEGALCDFTGGFTALFVVLAAVAAVGFAAACLLPWERRETAMAAAE